MAMIAMCGIHSCTDNGEMSTTLKSIKLDVTKIALEKNHFGTFTFKVTEPGAKFNHEIGSDDCQISFEVVKSSTTGSKPYQFTSVSSLGKGKYEVLVKDLGKSDSYQEQVVIRISADTEVVSEPITITSSGSSIFSMTILKANNETAVYEDIDLTCNNGRFTVKSPLISKPNLILSFETNGDKVLIGETEQISGETANDFSEPVTYKVVSASGSTQEYVVDITYSGLPVMYIKTANNADIPSKHEDWLEGTEIKLYNTDWEVDYEGTNDNIRGRGNSTWNYAKKPYALKLDSKAKILGMPKHKRWVLLANWMDRTMMRNRIAFAVAMKTDLAWTPHGEFVELFVNGVHKGNYYLCEHIKIDENRVNIDELDDTKTDSGYMMELDTYYDEVNKFRSQYYNLPYMFKDPDEVNNTQFDFLQKYVNDMEASLKDNTKFAAREYTNYIDMDSFADWWLVHEITGNAEPRHPKSSYMHKDKGGKFHMGPVWDFDWETFKPNTSDKLILKDTYSCLYYARLFQDSQFKAKVKEQWNKHEAGFRDIITFIESEGERLKGSDAMNHEMWPITLDSPGCQGLVNGDEGMTFEEAVTRMKNAYSQKLEYMDQQISKW